jgi:hypothetical protein
VLIHAMVGRRSLPFLDLNDLRTLLRQSGGPPQLQAITTQVGFPSKHGLTETERLRRRFWTEFKAIARDGGMVGLREPSTRHYYEFAVAAVDLGSYFFKAGNGEAVAQWRALRLMRRVGGAGRTLGAFTGSRLTGGG